MEEISHSAMPHSELRSLKGIKQRSMTGSVSIYWRKPLNYIKKAIFGGSNDAASQQQDEAK